MKFDVIIAAAGNSERAGGNKLKFDLGGMPLLHRTVAAFSAVERVDSIILCVKAGDKDFAAEALRKPNSLRRFHAFRNGVERLESRLRRRRFDP